ncbi:NAD(P)H-binding protein [Maribacter ulvicola]|uniref:Uncharacterized conserved protein YbjT, contains NAD(P)-binding and DUF2867 domains n=1 Tax=Maribacter ulvicola TaxID=228959 RepID=A0A1N6UGM9_9FLAO|nr:NAD(P)H-binding protein [Maribacter ulvicola]SIQ64838.1 Uncharacterized conserved protein YbjT, contains NAD(P)-binding and DUF2867 domains [Maribacter ulvicola]
MKKTAIILGASGLTGGLLLEKLISDDRYINIKLFSRSRIEGLPNKVHQYIGNLLELDQFKKEFTANEVYCCIGTTAKKTPDKRLYRAIDYGIPVAAAKLAKENGISTYIVVSAMGANKKSKVFYNKTKGEMEQDVVNQNIPATSILRPSLIGGEREEQRVLEKIGIIVFKVLQPLLIGPLKKYRLVDAGTIALAMIKLANKTGNSDVVVTSNEIEKIAKTNLR